MTTLEFVKSQENEESLILIMDDLPSKKVMAAWSLYASPESRVEFITREMTKKDKSVWHLLAEMWGKCPPVDMERMTKLSISVPYPIVVETFARLKEARFIYPDCTIPISAKKLIRNEISSYRLNLVPRGARNLAGMTTNSTASPVKS